MAERQNIGLGDLFVFWALDPKTGGVTRKVYIRGSLLHHYKRERREPGLRDIALILEPTLRAPRRVYHGILRQGRDRIFLGGDCYVGPGEGWKNDGNYAEGFVYMIYVNASNFLFQMGWQEADGLERDKPKDFRTRFTREVWPC